MKLNFWQWIGVALLVLGAIYLVYDKFAGKQEKSPAPQPPAATQPTTQT